MAKHSPAPKMNYYEGPTHFYTAEEKSYTVFQGYKCKVLTSPEVTKFLFKDRLNTWTTWGFPVATYTAFTYSGILNRFLGYRFPSSYKIIVPLVLTSFLWLAWVNKNPFQDSLNEEKQNLLDLLERRIGVSMKAFNDVLPRYWTTQEIHRKTRQLYNERNGLFVNILYPSEESMNTLFDLDTYSYKNRLDKVTK